jgi:Cof subfamily protein (haloacid dehalogenase superfamily)
MAACCGITKNNNWGEMGIRLVVSDVDGTLVTKDKRITPAALDAIRLLREQGIKFTVISSRPPQAIRVVGNVIGLTDPVPAFNGGLLVGPDLKTVHREKLLDQVVAARLLERLQQSNVDIWVYTDTHWYVPSLTAPYVEHEIHSVKYEPMALTDFSVIRKDRIAKIVGVSEDFDALAVTEKKVQTEFRGAVSASLSQKYYLDITHPSANKGEGILLLSELLQIPPSQIATIGDMQNDVYMFKKSGLSIAMGNAAPEVQQQANYVTATNEDEGFAKAMERHILVPQHATANKLR